MIKYNHKKVKVPKIDPNKDAVVSSADNDPSLLFNIGFRHPLGLAIRIEDREGNNITNDFAVDVSKMVLYDDNNASLTIKMK